MNTNAISKVMMTNSPQQSHTNSNHFCGGLSRFISLWNRLESSEKMHSKHFSFQLELFDILMWTSGNIKFFGGFQLISWKKLTSITAKIVRFGVDLLPYSIVVSIAYLIVIRQEIYEYKVPELNVQLILIPESVYLIFRL